MNGLDAQALLKEARKRYPVGTEFYSAKETFIKYKVKPGDIIQYYNSHPGNGYIVLYNNLGNLVEEKGLAAIIYDKPKDRWARITSNHIIDLAKALEIIYKD